MYTKALFTFTALWIASILLGACTSLPEPTATLPPSLLPTETRTPEPSFTWTPEPSSTSAFTATPTPFPILISLMESGGDGLDELDYCLRAYSPSYKFVLYEDGFLINYRGSFQTAQLSQEEINDLLKQIEDTGFFDVEGSGDLRENDPIYDYDFEENGYVGDGGYSETISVLDKQVWVYAPLGQYLIAPIRDTIDIIRPYSHEDEIPFIPNRLGVYMLPNVNRYTDPESLQEALIGYPQNIQIKWPDDLPAIDGYYKTFEGEDIYKLLEILPKIPSYGVFVDGENTSFVFTCFPER